MSAASPVTALHCTGRGAARGGAGRRGTAGAERGGPAWCCRGQGGELRAPAGGQECEGGTGAAHECRRAPPGLPRPCRAAACRRLPLPPTAAATHRTTPTAAARLTRRGGLAADVSVGNNARGQGRRVRSSGGARHRQLPHRPLQSQRQRSGDARQRRRRRGRGARSHRRRERGDAGLGRAGEQAEEAALLRLGHLVQEQVVWGKRGDGREGKERRQRPSGQAAAERDGQAGK